MKGPSGLELNGVANIDMLVQGLEAELVHFEKHPADDTIKKTINNIKEQLDTLNRYMTAVSAEVRANHKEGKTYVEIPLWHEVRENKDKYKTNGGQ